MQAIKHDMTERMIEPYDSEKLKSRLEDPAVKEVRVFKLQKGMRINIRGGIYKVVAARPNGKITLRYKGKERE